MAKKIKRPDKVTLNVQIPKDLHEEFKLYAIKFGEPMRFYVQRAIQELITRHTRDELQKSKAQESITVNL